MLSSPLRAAESTRGCQEGLRKSSWQRFPGARTSTPSFVLVLSTRFEEDGAWLLLSQVWYGLRAPTDLRSLVADVAGLTRTEIVAMVGDLSSAPRHEPTRSVLPEEDQPRDPPRRLRASDRLTNVVTRPDPGRPSR
jgi:hypothetical protein